MALTPEDITRIARLARLELSETEADRMRSTINDFFGIVAQMQAVDTTGVAPMSHPQVVSLRLRDDVVSESDRRAAYQAVAPSVENGLYLVPKVIE